MTIAIAIDDAGCALDCRAGGRARCFRPADLDAALEDALGVGALFDPDRHAVQVELPVIVIPECRAGLNGLTSGEGLMDEEGGMHANLVVAIVTLVACGRSPIGFGAR